MGRPKGLRKINGKWVQTLGVKTKPVPVPAPLQALRKVVAKGEPIVEQRAEPKKTGRGRQKGLRKDPVTGKWYMPSEVKLTQPASETIKARAKRDPEFREALAQEDVAPIHETKPKSRPKGSKNKVKPEPELNLLPVVEAVEEKAKAPEGRKRERDFAWKRNDYTLVKTNSDANYRPAIVQEITGSNILVKWLGNSPSQFDIIQEKYLFTMGEAI